MHQDIRQLPPSLEPFPLLMTLDEFLIQYKPVINAMNPAAQHGGFLYSTSGPEFDILCGSDMSKVWTLRATDSDLLIISNGLMLNDCTGYFVTRESHNPSFAIEVIMNPHDLFLRLNRFHGLSRLSNSNQLSQGMQIALAQWHKALKDGSL